MHIQEKRDHQRIPVVCEVKCRAKDDTFTPYHTAELMDIHHQGCRLLGSKSFKPGDVISIMADLHPEGPLKMEGVAAWGAPVYKDRVFQTGVRFLTDDPKDEDTYLKLFHFCLLKMPR